MNRSKLNEICLNITDGTHSTVKDNSESNYYLLSCKNIKNGKIIINEKDRTISYDTLMLLRKRTDMEFNDVLLTSVGTIGESSVITERSPNFEFQRSVAVLKPDAKYILSKYLHYFFISTKGQRIIKENIKGAAQPCLFLNDIKNIEIDYPSIKTQQHIVNTIGSVDDLIENYQKQADKICDILRQSINKYNEYVTISEYDPDIIKSGIKMFDNEKTYLDTSSINGVNNITSGELITYNKKPSRANIQPIGNSVWFAKMKDSNKILIITDKDQDIIKNNILSTGFLGIKSSNKLPLSLLTAIIISDHFKVQRDLNSVGTTMAGINNETFSKILVPKLTDEEIKEYDKKYNNLVYRLSYIRQEIKLLSKIKENLLSKYF